MDYFLTIKVNSEEIKEKFNKFSKNSLLFFDFILLYYNNIIIEKEDIYDKKSKEFS